MLVYAIQGIIWTCEARETRGMADWQRGCVMWEKAEDKVPMRRKQRVSTRSAFSPRLALTAFAKVVQLEVRKH